MAKAIYKKEVKSSFKLMHCHRILSCHPKWQQYQDNKSKARKPFSKNKKRTAVVEEAGTESEEESGVPVTRPVGRKAAKCHENLKRKEGKFLDMMIKNQERLMQQGKERAEAMKRNLEAAERRAQAAEKNTEVMTMVMDPSTISNPLCRSWLESIQQEIMLKRANCSVEQALKENDDEDDDSDGENKEE
jgi:hypothetical protein